LNNELYIGRLVWNRLTYLKDPDTGRRISRLNPPEAHIIHELPDLRLLDQSLWDKVKQRQQIIKRMPQGKKTGKGFRSYRRPKYLFSGMVKCGSCGGTYTLMAKNYYGCSTRHNKRTCDNKLYIRHDRLEATVLDGLRHHLIQPESFDTFCDAFTAEVNRLRRSQHASQASHQAELHKIESEIAKLITALKEGGPAKPIVAEINRLEDQQDNLKATLAQTRTLPPFLHPSMSKLYASKLKKLYSALGEEEDRQEAITLIRSLIDRITLVPSGDRLRIRIEGDLAGLLSFTASNEESLILQEDKALQLELVAGACNYGRSAMIIAD
ncbi:recombinase zinc beta ribbon domain-containing protein, partial [Paremcibacter congregatus]|uniref:recombinase zinc beta ribbon domain-containing protein n=1 Tax=Paremcibacter congregatus TaxID=2043170 RepID=UPI003A8CDFF7